MMSNMVEQQGQEAERALLGCALQYGSDAWHQVCDKVTRDDFSTEAHRTVYDAIDAVDMEEEVGVIPVLRRLEADGTLSDIGGRQYITQLIGRDLVLPCGLMAEVNTLHLAANTRQVGSTVESMRSEVDSGDYSPQEMAGRFAEMAIKLDTGIHRDRKESFSSADMARGVLEEYRAMVALRATGRKYAGLDCGFDSINDKLNGLRPEEMTILAARPSIGKTTLALQIASHVAISTGKHVGIWSCEMSSDQVGRRIVQMMSQVDGDRFNKGYLSQQEEAAMELGNAAFSKLPITTYEMPGLTVPQFIAKAEQLRSRYDVGLMIVDHVHRMNGPGDGGYERYGKISQGLRDYSLPTGTPHLLVLAQLSRKAEDRVDKRPQLADLRDAGQLEQDAVNAILLHRPGFYSEMRQQVKENNDASDALLSHVEALCAKTRFGTPGDIRLSWDSTRALFQDAPTTYREEPADAFQSHPNN